MRKDWILGVVLLGLGLGCGALWVVRERASREPVAVRAAAPVRVAAPVVVAPTAIRGTAANVRVPDSSPVSSVSSSVSSRVPAEVVLPPAAPVVPRGAVSRNRSLPPSLAADVLAAIEAEDQDGLQRLRDLLLAGGEESLQVLEGLLVAGIWRVELFAMEMLAAIGTPEARLAAIGHLLTRPSGGSRGWHRLAHTISGMLDGSAVDLLLGMLADAEGHARRRVMGLLGSVSGEDALLRLYLAAEESEDQSLKHVAGHVLFRGRRPGSEVILKEIMLSHEDPNVMAMAAMGLARSGQAGSIRFLAETGNGSTHEAELARWALERTSRRRAPDVLVDIAQSPVYSSDVRVAAVRALGRGRRNDSLNEALQQIATTANDANVRSAAQQLFQDI
jgi:hypothetical protein